MSLFGNILKGAGKLALNAASEAMAQSQKKIYQNSSQSGRKIGGKSINEWDTQWRSIGILSNIDLTPYNKYVGLYRARLGSEIVYIGRAIEWNNGGFRKRLSDYTRESNSARTHGSGQKMYEHRHQLQIDLLLVGQSENAAKVTSVLEGLMVGKYNPTWNKVKNFNF
ncbi:hypothetical protein V1498_10105 [Peribacillus sp. SCS-26]|uniref:hypothetical protein n=1 Tax=Paraperibacillus marinus TaxID=3115295 RepID=UPI0039060C82